MTVIERDISHSSTILTQNQTSLSEYLLKVFSKQPIY